MKNLKQSESRELDAWGTELGLIYVRKSRENI
jgi:hypothetical protein